jgi:hypothetical protein
MKSERIIFKRFGKFRCGQQNAWMSDRKFELKSSENMISATLGIWQ